MTTYASRDRRGFIIKLRARPGDDLRSAAVPVASGSPTRSAGDSVDWSLAWSDEEGGPAGADYAALRFFFAWVTDFASASDEPSRDIFRACLWPGRSGSGRFRSYGPCSYTLRSALDAFRALMIRMRSPASADTTNSTRICRDGRDAAAPPLPCLPADSSHFDEIHRLTGGNWSGLFSGPTLASDGGREKCCYSVSDQMPL